eukprot:4321801-Amphidinium_carterae.1
MQTAQSRHPYARCNTREQKGQELYNRFPSALDALTMIVSICSGCYLQSVEHSHSHTALLQFSFRVPGSMETSVLLTSAFKDTLCTWGVS